MTNKLQMAGFTLAESIFIQQILEESPFISLPSEDMAREFAKAAVDAGHKTVSVAKVKGRIGVFLGTMSHDDAGVLLQKLRNYGKRS